MMLNLILIEIRIPQNTILLTIFSITKEKIYNLCNKQSRWEEET